jgi:hypothetical protein
MNTTSATVPGGLNVFRICLCAVQSELRVTKHVVIIRD